MQEHVQGQGRVEVLNFAVTGDNLAAEDFTTSTITSTSMSAAQTSQQYEPPVSTTTPDGQSLNQTAGTLRPSPAAVRQQRSQQASASGQVVYHRGPITGIPDDYASRKERFAELDQLEAGWQVELRSRGETVDAIFYSPDGEQVGAFATARRLALQAHRQALQL